MIERNTRSIGKEEEKKKLGRSPWQKQRSSLGSSLRVIHLSGRVCGAPATDPLMHNFLRELESLMFPSYGQTFINLLRARKKEKYIYISNTIFPNRDEYLEYRIDSTIKQN